jgi:hypothetical protein
MNRRRFILFAVVLSAAWYPVLLVSPIHRDFLTQTGRFKDMEHGSPLYYILCMIAAGLVLAWSFRRQIVSASTAQSVVFGCILPYLCTGLFMTLIGLPVLLEPRLNLHDWWAVIIMGISVTLLWLPLVAPVGIAVQFILRWAGKPGSTSTVS